MGKNVIYKIFTNAIVILLCLGVAPAKSDDNTILAIKYSNYGVRSYHSKDWNAALSHFYNSYNYSPQSRTAYYLSFINFRAPNNNADAVVYWANQAIKLRTFGQEKWVESSKRIKDKVRRGDWLMYARPDGFSIAVPDFQDENCYFTNWVSEESQPAICANQYFIKGIKCVGAYCNNKYLNCCRSIKGFYHGNTSWSYWFSEENNGHYFNTGRTLVGLACHHDYCDNISVLSMPSPSGQNRSCYRTEFYSEEGGYQECSSNYVVSGIACNGSYCDNIALYCCTE